MTENLMAAPGRVFIGPVSGSVKLFTVKSVRKRRDGTPSSCTIVWESTDGEVRAEASMSLPRDGMMRGYRRVTLAQVGIAKQVAQAVGRTVPTDAVVIVTRDRTGGTAELWEGTRSTPETAGKAG